MNSTQDASSGLVILDAGLLVGLSGSKLPRSNIQIYHSWMISWMISSYIIQIHPNSSNIFPYQDIMISYDIMLQSVLKIAKCYPLDRTDSEICETSPGSGQSSKPGITILLCLGPSRAGLRFWALFHEEQIECGLKQ